VVSTQSTWGLISSYRSFYTYPGLGFFLEFFYFWLVTAPGETREDKMQLLFLDIMLFTLVTIASAHFNFQVSRGGRVITHLYGGRADHFLQSLARQYNCAALFEMCPTTEYCCANSMGSLMGSPVTQMPTWTRYAIKCSAANYKQLGNKMQYTKVIHAGPKNHQYYANKFSLNRYCLPRTPKYWNHIEMTYMNVYALI